MQLGAEHRARDAISSGMGRAGHRRVQLQLHRVAVRKFVLPVGRCDHLFVGVKEVGVIEVKKASVTPRGVAEQAAS